MINRTYGIRQSQGNGRDYGGRPNIGQTRLNSGIEDLDRRTYTGLNTTIGIVKDLEDIQDQNFVEDKSFTASFIIVILYWFLKIDLDLNTGSQM
jgi:hypothetical protein